MKIASFKRVITPEIGAYLAGYGYYDKSNSIADDLYMTGLCVDDGERKALILKESMPVSSASGLSATHFAGWRFNACSPTSHPHSGQRQCTSSTR